METKSGNEENAALTQSKAEKIAALKRPLPKWPSILVMVFLPMALVFRTDHGNGYVIAVIFGISAGAVVGGFFTWILHLRRRIEALTALLLEQQERLDREVS